MALHQGPPPGYVDLNSVCKQLGMSRWNFYRSGLADLLESWQVKPNTPRLYSREDVGALGRWLFIRRGLIALGVLAKNEPLVNPRYEALVESGCHDWPCPRCEREAVMDYLLPQGRVWCPDCGIAPLDVDFGAGQGRQPISDTHPQIEQMRIERLRQMPVWRKMELVGEMNQTVRAVALAGLRQRYPDNDPAQQRRRLADLTLGPKLAARVYGPLVEAV